jgi:hypothetical protein
MNKNLFALAGTLAVLAVLWISGQVLGYGTSFDKPSVPAGAKVQGPSAKGLIMYKVQPITQTATIEFHGQCTVGQGKSAITYNVDTQTLDVTLITNVNGFVAATPAQIADSVEGFFNTQILNASLKQCWPNAFGVYVQAVNGAGSFKDNTNTEWDGDATLKGVF